MVVVVVEVRVLEVVVEVRGEVVVVVVREVVVELGGRLRITTRGQSGKRPLATEVMVSHHWL